MNKLKTGIALLLLTGMFSCGQTTEKGNSTSSQDTMVIKHDQTDSATTTVSRDTTRK